MVATSEVEVHDRSILERIDAEPHKGLDWNQAAEQLAEDTRLLFAREYCFDSPLVRAHPVLQNTRNPALEKIVRCSLRCWS